MIGYQPNPFETLPSWSDTWGSWNSRALAALDWLERVSCLKCRYALAPSLEFQAIPAAGYLSYNLRLVPGSVVWGFALPDNGADLDTVSLQITDLSLGHQFFQEPLMLSSLTPLGRRQGWFEAFNLLPVPHPVTGDGLIRVEFWGPVGETVFLIFGVAEVAACDRLEMAVQK